MLALIVALTARAACPETSVSSTCGAADGCGIVDYYGLTCQNCTTTLANPGNVGPYGCKVVDTTTIVPMNAAERHCFTLLNSGICRSASVEAGCTWVCPVGYVGSTVCCVPCSGFNAGSAFEDECNLYCVGVYNNTCSSTRAPVTYAPVSVAPTTFPPSTHAPVTYAPVTVAPTDDPGAPTTVAPTTVSPTSHAPTTHAPVTIAPTTGAPIDHTAAPTSAAQGSDTSLSTGDIAAIAVGAVLAVVLVASVVVFVRKRNGTTVTAAHVGNRYAAL